MAPLERTDVRHDKESGHGHTSIRHGETLIKISFNSIKPESKVEIKARNPSYSTKLEKDLDSEKRRKILAGVLYETEIDPEHLGEVSEVFGQIYDIVQR